MKMNRFEFIMMDNPIRRLIQNQIEIKNFLDVKNEVNDKTVLEIGCGSGYGATIINKYFQPRKIYGIDLDKKMIALANKNRQSNTIFNVENVTKLSFKSSTIDGVFDFGILHHISDWEKAIDEIYRVLKPEGQLFIEDFSIESFESFLGKLIKPFTDHPYSSMYRTEEFFEYLKPKFKTIKKKVYKSVGLINYFIFVGKRI